LTFQVDYLRIAVFFIVASI